MPKRTPIVERIRGATILIDGKWRATAWVVGRKHETGRIDWLACKERERARGRIERCRDAVYNSEAYAAPITGEGGAA